MKKLVLVLGLATLFSCEKEENKVCDCVLTWEQKKDDSGVTFDPNNKENKNWHWEIVETDPTKKDFCDNTITRYSRDSVNVQRYICK